MAPDPTQRSLAVSDLESRGLICREAMTAFNYSSVFVAHHATRQHFITMTASVATSNLTGPKIDTKFSFPPKNIPQRVVRNKTAVKNYCHYNRKAYTKHTIGYLFGKKLYNISVLFPNRRNVANIARL